MLAEARFGSAHHCFFKYLDLLNPFANVQISFFNTIFVISLKLTLIRDSSKQESSHDLSKSLIDN